MQEQGLYNRKQIKDIIPYSEPFLFVDEVKKIKENRIFGTYQTSIEALYFRGHFVGFPIMPGVLTIEALAQLSTILLRQKLGEAHKEYHLLAYDVKDAQFYKPIFPGDKIALQAEIAEFLESRIAQVRAKALVKKELRCKAAFSIAIVRKAKFEAKYSTESHRA